MQAMPVFHELPPSQQEATVLVVVFHAFTSSPVKMRYVRQAVESLVPDCHILAPQLPFGTLSFADPVHIAEEMVAAIDRQVTFRRDQGWPEFNRIILIGHSLGALLARKVYVLAGPESSEARFKNTADLPLAVERPWFRKVSRIVLFAGMNRGWRLTHHVKFFRSIAWWVSTFLADTLMAFTGDKARLVILNSRFGAPFLTELRLQWLALQRTNAQLKYEAEHTGAEVPPLALTVQLLGTIDDMVAPSDNIDLATGREFVYLDVPFSGHGDVIDLDGSPEGKARLDVFRHALTSERELLERENILPVDGILVESGKVSNVIFVVHGIRDTGYWTEKLARRVQRLGGEPPKIYATETSTYGYFGMLPFLLPSERRKKVQWLMDQYVSARSLYPNARFSYIGHSNGTYLGAKALEDYRSCRFDRMVFIGSVVRTGYPWDTMIANGQVGAVVNYVATADAIVAVLPGAWEQCHLQDLGSAGHNGFKTKSPLVCQPMYHGGHSAAREEKNWNSIASFIVAPTLAFPPETLLQKSRLVVAAGKAAVFCWAVLIALVSAIGWILMWSAKENNLKIAYAKFPHLAAAAHSSVGLPYSLLALVLYVLLLSVVVRKV